jgi:hypothetical protein
MPSDSIREHTARHMQVRLVALKLALVLGVTLAVAAPPEDQLFRQVKVDVFDQNWSAVLRGCEEILASYPSGTSAAQASFYRARALTRIPGRQAEGIQAFRTFMADHPGDRVMVEQAWAALFSAACEPRTAPRPECPAILKDGLGSASHYVSTLAAIQASDSSDVGLRRRALGILKQAYDTEADTEIRNEILIAILKIDPKQVPSTEAQRPRVPEATSRKSSPGTHPTLIRMTVYNKQEKRYDLKVNLPVAFARMLIDAVGQDQKEEMRNVARGKGIDLDDIFDAIETSGAGKLLEVDDATCHIEIWIE